jgi:hypothetical protein
VLSIERDYLYFLIGKLPADLREQELSPHEAWYVFEQMRSSSQFFAARKRSRSQASVAGKEQEP